jgi:hypothetical protein
MTNFEIIPLALRKMARRNIPVEWVKQTLNSPEQIVAGYEGRKVAQKIYNLSGQKMLLRVIFETAGIKKIVVTAYLTSQLERYWRKE